MTMIYRLYNGHNLDYGSLIWSQLIQSLSSSTKFSEISCGRFWTIITQRAITSLQIPIMANVLLSSVATFHTKKVIIADPSKFSHVGSIPESIYRCVPPSSKIMEAYRKLRPTGPRVLSPEMKVALDVVEKPTKRGKKKEYRTDDLDEGASSKPDKTKKSDKEKSKKRPSEKEASSDHPKKIKRMA